MLAEPISEVTEATALVLGCLDDIYEACQRVPLIAERLVELAGDDPHGQRYYDLQRETGADWFEELLGTVGHWIELAVGGSWIVWEERTPDELRRVRD